jgi:hypothetical protein
MPPEFNSHFSTFFRMFTEQLATILPPDTNLPAAYDAGNDDQQAFVQNLALFYTGFFRVRAVGCALWVCPVGDHDCCAFMSRAVSCRKARTSAVVSLQSS